LTTTLNVDSIDMVRSFSLIFSSVAVGQPDLY